MAGVSWPPVELAVEAVDGGARAGSARTARGTYLTPCFMPVGTRGAVKHLSADDYDRLGVQIVLDPVAADLRVSPGTYGWAGAYGTNQNMDPKEKMVSIIMMQGASGPLQRDFENAVWQAMIE